MLCHCLSLLQLTGKETNGLLVRMKCMVVSRLARGMSCHVGPTLRRAEYPVVVYSVPVTTGKAFI